MGRHSRRPILHKCYCGCSEESKADFVIFRFVHNNTYFKGRVSMKTILVSDYFDSTSPFEVASAIKTAARCGEECEILFDGKTHIFECAVARSCDIHVSNTHEEGNDHERERSDSITRNTPLLLENLENVTLNGNGSVLKLNGKMTFSILRNCKNVTFKNFVFDYVTPVVAEMTVIGEGEKYIDCKVSYDSLYRIIEGRLEWCGENFAFKTGVSQIFRPKTGFTWRYPSPIQDKNARFEEIRRGVIRIHFNPKTDGSNPYGVELGDVLQMRDPIREECGFIIDKCENTRFENVTVHMMDGLGFIAQNCNGITLDRFRAFPTFGRTTACAADFMHFCR